MVSYKIPFGPLILITCSLNVQINSYGDDTSPYSCAEDMSSIVTELQRIAKQFFSGGWYENNHMKAYPEKIHVLLSSNIQTRVVPFENAQITSSLTETLLGINFDSELTFEEHISKICNIVNKQLHAFTVMPIL